MNMIPQRYLAHPHQNEPTAYPHLIQQLPQRFLQYEQGHGNANLIQQLSRAESPKKELPAKLELQQAYATEVDKDFAKYGELKEAALDPCKVLLSGNLFDLSDVAQSVGGDDSASSREVLRFTGKQDPGREAPEAAVSLCGAPLKDGSTGKPVQALNDLSPAVRRSVDESTRAVWKEHDGTIHTASQLTKKLIRNPSDKAVVGVSVEPDGVPLEVHVLCKPEVGELHPKLSSYKNSKGGYRVRVLTVEHAGGCPVETVPPFPQLMYETRIIWGMVLVIFGVFCCLCGSCRFALTVFISASIFTMSILVYVLFNNIERLQNAPTAQTVWAAILFSQLAACLSALPMNLFPRIRMPYLGLICGAALATQVAAVLPNFGLYLTALIILPLTSFIVTFFLNRKFSDQSGDASPRLLTAKQQKLAAFLTSYLGASCMVFGGGKLAGGGPTHGTRTSAFLAAAGWLAALLALWIGSCCYQNWRDEAQREEEALAADSAVKSPQRKVKSQKSDGEKYAIQSLKDHNNKME